MADKKDYKELEDKYADKHWEQWGMKNWRAWGSWFSWGSPVGLGLFFLAVAGTIWILSHL